MDRLMEAVQKLDYIERLIVSISKSKNENTFSNVNVFTNWLFERYVVLSNVQKLDIISFDILCKRSDLKKIQNRILELQLVVDH